LQLLPRWLYILSSTVEPAFSLIPVILAAFSLRVYRGDRWFAQVDSFLFLGFLLWFLGEFTWSFYTLILGVQIPYPSLADAFWLAGYPLVLVGMVAFVSPFKVAMRRRNLLVASVVSVAALGFVVRGLVLPVLSFSTDIISDVVGLAYPMLDIALLFALIMGLLLFWGGKMARWWYWLIAGAILTAVGDILFSYFTAIGTYYDGHPLELFFEFGYTCFGLAVHDRFRGLSQ